MLMDGTCKTKIQIAIMHGIGGGGGPYPQPPSSGKFSLMELIKLFIRIVKFLLKWQTSKKSLSNLVLGKKKLWIRAWLVFSLGLMQVSNLTLGCNSILY